MAWQLRKVGKAIPFLPPYFFPSHYSSSGWFSLGNFTTIIELITLEKYPLLCKKLFFTSLCRLLLTRAYAYWLKRVAQNSKIGVMKANQSFCCGFCFEGSSRDELSTISDFLSGFRESLYGMSFLWLRVPGFTMPKVKFLLARLSATSLRMPKELGIDSSDLDQRIDKEGAVTYPPRSADSYDELRSTKY